MYKNVVLVTILFCNAKYILKYRNIHLIRNLDVLISYIKFELKNIGKNKIVFILLTSKKTSG